MPTRGTGEGVFIEDYIDVPADFPSVEARLLGESTDWLGRCAERGEVAGADVVVRIGPGGILAPSRRRVRVHTGPWRSRGDAVVLPIEWESVRLRSLFPRLEGDLEVAPLGDDRCRLTLCGQYSPPLGQVGAALDRRVLHWVAGSTVRSFLDGLADALSAKEAPEAWGEPPGRPDVVERAAPVPRAPRRAPT